MEPSNKALAVVKPPLKAVRASDRLALAKFATGILEKHASIVDEFLTSPDPRIRFDCWKFLFQYRWGMPTQRVEFDMMDAARQLAERAGVSVEVLLSTAEDIVGKNGTSG